MDSKRTLVPLDIPDDLRVFVDEQVAKNRYRSVAECILAMLRRMKERQAAQAEFEAKLLEGVRSPKSEVTPEMWQRRNAEFERRHASRDAS